MIKGKPKYVKYPMIVEKRINVQKVSLEENISSIIGIILN